MIHACYASTGDGHVLEVTGHAAYQPGNDVVCAGCSAIVLALIGYLRNSPEHVTTLAEMTAEPGGARIRCSGDKFVAQAFLQALIGLRQIQQGYPDHIVVTEGL